MRVDGGDHIFIALSRYVGKGNPTMETKQAQETETRRCNHGDHCENQILALGLAALLGCIRR